MFDALRNGNELLNADLSWLMSIFIGKLVCLGENNSDKRQPKR